MLALSDTALRGTWISAVRLKVNSKILLVFDWKLGY